MKRDQKKLSNLPVIRALPNGFWREEHDFPINSVVRWSRRAEQWLVSEAPAFTEPLWLGGCQKGRWMEGKGDKQHWWKVEMRQRDFYVRESRPEWLKRREPGLTLSPI